MVSDLFIVTYSPFDFSGSGKLCVIIRKDPFIEPRSVVRLPYSQKPRPTLHAVSGLPHRNTHQGIIISQAYADLGDRMGKLVERSFKKSGRSFEWTDAESRQRIDTAYFGVFIPDAIEEMSRHTTLSYGVIDVLHTEDIEQQIRKQTRSEYEVPAEKVFRPGKKFMGRKISPKDSVMLRKNFAAKGKVVVIRLRLDCLTLTECSAAAGILAHFQKLEDERIAKIPQVAFRARGVAFAG